MYSFVSDTDFDEVEEFDVDVEGLGQKAELGFDIESKTVRIAAEVIDEVAAAKFADLYVDGSVSPALVVVDCGD